MRIVQPTTNQEYNNYYNYYDKYDYCFISTLFCWSHTELEAMLALRSFIGDFSRKASSGFHRRAELFEENFFFKKNFHQDGPTSHAKSPMHVAGQFAVCPETPGNCVSLN